LSRFRLYTYNTRINGKCNRENTILPKIVEQPFSY
jgi:hypothetical protein